MSGIAGAGISNEAALLAQPSLTENVLAHFGQVRVCMITSHKEPLTCPILLPHSIHEMPSARHAGQARILKALTRNSIISRTFGETNLREG
jgi:hypothetical protein